MKTKAGKWLRLFIVVFLMLLLCCASTVVVLDPYFHYHKPLPSFSYVLNNERAQNDGITKHFADDTLLTGTSRVEVMKA